MRTGKMWVDSFQKHVGPSRGVRAHFSFIYGAKLLVFFRFKAFEKVKKLYQLYKYL